MKNNSLNIQLIKYLSEFVTPNRFSLLQSVIKKRTRYLSIVLEDIYQPHNASAVLRSCDCFGIQDVHIIENTNQYNINPDIVVGSSKWLNLYKYNKLENNTLSTINSLKESGYRIVATTPHKNDVSLENFDLSKGKTALFFGSELPGLSNIVLDNADEFMQIPMYGFTESFNISVSAAICMHHLRHSLESSDLNWQLSEIEQQDILLKWLKLSIKSSKKITEQFMQKRN